MYFAIKCQILQRGKKLDEKFGVNKFYSNFFDQMSVIRQKCSKKFWSWFLLTVSLKAIAIKRLLEKAVIIFKCSFTTVSPMKNKDRLFHLIIELRTDHQLKINTNSFMKLSKI